MEMKDGLLDWLNADPLPEDLAVLPWDQNVIYLPIDSTRNKFDVMLNQFGAVVEQIDVTMSIGNTFDKETLIWATAKFIVYHKEFLNGQTMVCGTASFLKGQYDKGWAYSQIAESLATTRAFSKRWRQFGRGLNKEIDVKNLKAPTGVSKTNAVKNTLSGI